MLAHRSAFWMLILTLSLSNNDFFAHLLSSFLQRLLWETKLSLAIVSPGHVSEELSKFCKRHATCSKITQDTLKSHLHYRINITQADCPSLGSNKERPTDYDFQLLQLTCTQMRSSFVDCAQELMTSLSVKRKNNTVLKAVSLWFQVLQDSGYQFPDRNPFNASMHTSGSKGLPVWFTPSPCEPENRILEEDKGWNQDLKRKEDNVVQRLTQNPWQLIQECRGVHVTIDKTIPAFFKIPDILLIVVFNFPYLASHVPLLLLMYGRHFRHILFCGENFPSFIKFYRMDLYPHVSFIEINHAQGTWGYSCMSAAIKMNYDVTGYLQMSDDVLLNVWSLQNVPRDKFWYQSRVRVADIRLSRLPDIATTNRWYPWIFLVGRYAATVAVRTLKYFTSRQKYRLKVTSFLQQLRKTTQCSTCLAYEASDIFYVPRLHSQDFSFFLDIFQACRLHLEIAIPSAIFGLSAESDVFRLRGNYIWGDDRAEFKKYYSAFDHFQHAWKLTRLANKEGREFFCQNYLPWLEKDLKQ